MSVTRVRFEAAYLEHGEEALSRDPKLAADVKADAHVSALVQALEGLDDGLAALAGPSMPPMCAEAIVEAVRMIERPRSEARARRRLLRRLGAASAALAAVVLAVVVARSFTSSPITLRTTRIELASAAPALVRTDVTPRTSMPLGLAARGQAALSELEARLERGAVAPDMVDLDALLTAFPEEDPPSVSADAFTVRLESAPCPWKDGHALVRLGVRARDAGPIGEVPGNARVDVEFDPEQVSAYRLVAGGRGPVRIGQGFVASALYEVQPTGPRARGFIRVRLQYEEAGERRELIAQEPRHATTMNGASDELRFATASVMLGLGLRERDSESKRRLLEEARSLALSTHGAPRRDKLVDLTTLALAASDG